MDYIEKLNLQTEEVEEIENLEKHIITNNDPISVVEYLGHEGEFLAVDGNYDDGFKQLKKVDGLGISCIVSKEVHNLKTSLDNMASDIEELKQGNIEIDLTDYAKKSDLEVKADKSYVDSAIESVDVSGQLTNYATKTEVGNKVDKIDGKGLSTNDYTTAEKNKLSGLTNYTHPTSHSATMITEDSTHRFVTDNERSSWNNKSNLALGTTSTTAYRGDYGNTAYTHSQTAHAPSNAQKNSDITKSEIEAKLTGNITTHTHSQYLTSHQSLANYPKTTELTLGVHTDGLIYLFKGGQPVGNGVQGGNDAPILGYVDETNNIVLSGNLVDGTYTIKYELDDGTNVDIGVLNLQKLNYENLVYSSINTDKSIYNGVGYKDNIRLRTNGIEEMELSGYCASGFIPIMNGDVIRVKGLVFKDDFTKAVGYDSIFSQYYTHIYKCDDSTAKSSYFDITIENDGVIAFTSKTDYVAWVRFAGFGSGANMIITKNQPIK